MSEDKDYCDDAWIYEDDLDKDNQLLPALAIDAEPEWNASPLQWEAYWRNVEVQLERPNPSLPAFLVDLCVVDEEAEQRREREYTNKYSYYSTPVDKFGGFTKRFSYSELELEYSTDTDGNVQVAFVDSEEQVIVIPIQNLGSAEVFSCGTQDVYCDNCEVVCGTESLYYKPYLNLRGTRRTKELQPQSIQDTSCGECSQEVSLRTGLRPRIAKDRDNIVPAPVKVRISKEKDTVSAPTRERRKQRPT
jgi:hypothetical protein